MKNETRHTITVAALESWRRTTSDHNLGMFEWCQQAHATLAFIPRLLSLIYELEQQQGGHIETVEDSNGDQREVCTTCGTSLGIV
jgi:hypothetical protein